MIQLPLRAQHQLIIHVKFNQIKLFLSPLSLFKLKIKRDQFKQTRLYHKTLCNLLFKQSLKPIWMQSLPSPRRLKLISQKSSKELQNWRPKQHHWKLRLPNKRLRMIKLLTSHRLKTEQTPQRMPTRPRKQSKPRCQIRLRNVTKL